MITREGPYLCSRINIRKKELLMGQWRKEVEGFKWL